MSLQKIGSVALAALLSATVSGCQLRLPEQLPRTDYEEVNEVLTRLGGSWKGGKTAAHIFPYEVAPLLEPVLATGLMPPKNELSFFGTPTPVGTTLLEECISMMSKPPAYVVEPHGGHGALAALVRDRWPEAKLDVVEIEPYRAALLRGKGYTVHEQDFLTFQAQQTIDLVPANPPFTTPDDDKAYIEHIYHAWSQITPDTGVLGAIVPMGFTYNSTERVREFRKFIKRHGYWKPIPAGAFAESGTTIPTAMIILHKFPTQVEDTAEPVQEIDESEIDETVLECLLTVKPTEANFKEELREANWSTVLTALARLEAAPAKGNSARIKAIAGQKKKLEREQEREEEREERLARYDAESQYLAELIKPLLDAEIWTEISEHGMDDSRLSQVLAQAIAKADPASLESEGWSIDTKKRLTFTGKLTGRVCEKDSLVSRVRHACDIPRRHPDEIMEEVLLLEAESNNTMWQVEQMLGSLYPLLTSDRGGLREQGLLRWLKRLPDELRSQLAEELTALQRQYNIFKDSSLCPALHLFWQEQQPQSTNLPAVSANPADLVVQFAQNV